MRKINVGFIGIGNMGLLHMMNSLHMKHVNVEAVADTSKNMLSKAGKLGVKKSYTDYQELYDKEKDNLDAVIISLPNFLHHDSIVTGLESGLDVFIEKPITVNVEECRDIIKIEGETGRRVMPGHSMRYHNAILKLKEELDSGRVGSLEIVTLESIQNGPLSHGSIPKPISEWFFDPEKSGGGSLIDLGYHLIDIFHMFCGDSKPVYTQLGYKYNLPVEDGATVILNSEDDTRGIINVGWFEKTIFPRFNFRMILHGSADYQSTDDIIPKNLYLHAIKEGTRNFFLRVTGKKIRPLSYTYHYESYYRELEDFFECLIEDKDFPITTMDGLKTMQVISDAYKLSDARDYSN